ncbi:MAG: PHP domain-containing protein [Planctomycetia bacterium]|nr:PHP domain-containing protein [Planctomycetia bacterium]
MTPQAVWPCDMHTHTTRSDGHDTPEELIEHAIEAGLYALGLCDHDTVPPESILLTDGRTVEFVPWARERGLIVVPGCEYSCDTLVDDVHICGYGLDWRHADVLAEQKAAQASKSNAYRELVERLAAAGMDVDWERDLLHYKTSDGADAVRTADEVQRKHIFELLAARGYFPSWSEAKKAVQGNSEWNVRRRKIDPVAAIHMIHRAGGLAVLAHPYLIAETVRTRVDGREVSEMTRADYIDILLQAGLDGMEANYTYDKTTWTGVGRPEDVAAEIRARYSGRVKFISGGSDYHADYRTKAVKQRFLGERGISRDDFLGSFGKLITIEKKDAR